MKGRSESGKRIRPVERIRQANAIFIHSSSKSESEAEALSDSESESASESASESESGAESESDEIVMAAAAALTVSFFLGGEHAGVLSFFWALTGLGFELDSLVLRFLGVPPAAPDALAASVAFWSSL
jgi:hypothetical protein